MSRADAAASARGVAAESWDVVVLGSGAAGLTAALAAALAGARAVVIEHAERFGGTSARSSGTLWIPGNHHLGREAERDRARARRYLEALVEGRGEPALLEAFLRHGPRMLADLERRAGLAVRPFPLAPDYRQELPGAALRGRALEPAPFDGRALGALFARLEPPLPELLLAGGTMVTRAEAQRLLRAPRDLADAAFAVRLFARTACDRLHGWPRGTRLVMGNALVARLARAFLARGGTLRLGTVPVRLLREGERVVAVEVREREGATRLLRARRAVILAGGGFPASAACRERFLPRPVAPGTPAVDGADGSTIALARALGAALAPVSEDHALWFPSSLVPREGGGSGVFPHIVLDRPKPGMIAVDSCGRRFVDEACSYHEFVRAMYRRHREVPAIPAHLVCDARALWSYGLGAVRPRALFVDRWVRRGYLARATTLDELARAIGVDPRGLAETVARVNRFAESGVDPDFGKGASAYDRAHGDPEHRPNPCLGPLREPPFYAVALWPTPLATSLGLRIDARARVLDAGGRPIPGLYACGADAQHLFAGEYPGPGAQLGPAMTFAWLAARHALGLEPEADEADRERACAEKERSG
ncbi:MAG: FAD-dependent oxidoreductase [Geminicoccaceae bacterium]|nr:FAD-dependent oxidoreductase [Geminicoccaceae bacterium]